MEGNALILFLSVVALFIALSIRASKLEKRVTRPEEAIDDLRHALSEKIWSDKS